ncbi:MAG: winged helix-turn-helix domain-containing protein [Nitrososphaerota archaeon]
MSDGQALKKEYRSKLRICIDILESISRVGWAQQSYLMREANLSYDRLIKYLEFLASRELITINQTHGLYSLTDKGAQLLNEFKRFEKLAKAFGIDV